MVLSDNRARSYVPAFSVAWAQLVLLGLWSVAQRQGVTVPNRYS